MCEIKKENGSDSLPFSFIDEKYVIPLLPKREKDSHKGSYGKALLLCGSEKYRGAAMLSLESALRTGVGIAYLCSEASVVRDACVRLPEGIYRETSPISKLKLSEISNLTTEANAILIGCGCTVSESLGELVIHLLEKEGAPLVIDADGINSLSLFGDLARSALKKAKRQVVLTPHPAEMGRLCSLSVNEIQNDRLRIAYEFAREHNLTLVLKGNRSIVTDGEKILVDELGGPELAKGGSGDVLAGAVCSLLAQGLTPVSAVGVATYLHSKAAKTLSKEFSEYGVCPSELPRQMAREIAIITGRYR
jgi:NAD(P)H-hydrate epimerase